MTLTNSEMEFFAQNKEKIYDLIRAVDQHEHIRAMIGAASIEHHPHLEPDYVRAHESMSRLSKNLGEQLFMGVALGPLNDYSDLPLHLGVSRTIIGSC